MKRKRKTKRVKRVRRNPRRLVGKYAARMKRKPPQPKFRVGQAIFSTKRAAESMARRWKTPVTTLTKRNPVAQYVIAVRERRGAKKWYVQAGKLIQEKRFADRFFSLHAARTVAKTTQRRINSSYSLSNRFLSVGIEKS